MLIKELVKELDHLAPFAYAENFDNVGLIVGDYEKEITGVLLTYDCLEKTVQEAVEKQLNCIITFHPIWFNAKKSLSPNNYVDRTILAAIKNDIHIICLHTNLDAAIGGVNFVIAELLGLQKHRALIPKKNILKLTTYAPKDNAEAVRTALFAAGAGHIGNYDECSYNLSGFGTFRPMEKANPTLGVIGERHTEPEECIQVVFEEHLTSKVLSALKEAHCYEEVAYEIFSTLNENQHIGLGRVGDLSASVSEKEFLLKIKEFFQTKVIRHSEFTGKDIQRVAFLGGSGAFAISAAIRSGADAFISSDFKYHDFLSADKKILLLDVGHFESEQITLKIFSEFFNKKNYTFAHHISECISNPVYYFN